MKRIVLSATVALVLLVCEACAQDVHVFQWNRGRSTIALLFIHGLGGCAVPNGKAASAFCRGTLEDSFRNPTTNASWPNLIANDRRPIARNALEDSLRTSIRMGDLGVWGVDYSSLTTSPCGDFSIPQVAQAVRAQVEASGVYDQYEQVIIVTHSMGGLVAKSMLLDWQVSGDREKMLARTIGVLLLGVPSQGSPNAPEPGIKRYFLEVLGIDRVARVCGRQVKDLFAGDENTFLVDLERRWESLLGARRAASLSQAPLVYCAYETVPEQFFWGFSRTIVERLYAQTQCSLAQFPIARPHTMLPKPLNENDDVHRGWLARSLDDLFSQWVTWPFVRFTFRETTSYSDLAERINHVQNAFRLVVGEISGVKPSNGEYDAPNDYALVAKIISANPGLCMDSKWQNLTTVTIRLEGRCSH